MEEYFNHPNISQSKLKALLIHPRAFSNEREQDLYFEEKKHFTIGSAVDFCLTQSGENFDEVYHVSNLENKPSDTIKSIVKQVFDHCLEAYNLNVRDLGPISAYGNAVLDSCNEHNYQNRWNDQTRINKVCEHYEYWEDLKASYGKTILSQEEKTLIDTIVMSLRTSENTSKYFNASNTVYQLGIYFNHMDVHCKALLDMVIMDEEAKTIQPIDIKTMGDYTVKFPVSLRQRRYDIQAAFYTKALRYAYPEYKILNFKFIVESTISPGEPLVYTCNQSLLSIGRVGRPEILLKGDIQDSHGLSEVYYSQMREIKGFEQLLKLYKYYQENGFEKDKFIVDNEGEFNIDWSGVIDNKTKLVN